MRRLNGFAFDNTPRGIATRTFIDYVEKESNGLLKIESFPIETYGTEHEMIEAVQKGTLDLQIVGANMLANTIPPFAALSLPYLTKNFDEGLAVLDGTVGNHLKKLSKEYGIEVLGDVALGYAQITNNVRPINSPDDLLGLKMRSPNEFSFIETFKAFGSFVSTIGYEELYKGLSRGSFDGQFNPLSNIFDLKIYDVQNHLAISNHAFYVAFIIMNKDVFDRLDPEFQQILLKAGERGRDAARKYIGGKEEELRAKAETAFKEITYPEMEPFQEVVLPIYAKMEEVMGAEIINGIQDFLKEYRRKKIASLST